MYNKCSINRITYIKNMLYVNYYVPQLGSAERGVVITQSTTNAVNNHYRPVLTDTNTI